jgi:diguanylate cyclase (GGDEF)-like protein
MNPLFRHYRRNIAIGLMCGLSLGILSLGFGLRSQIAQQRQFFDSELVVAVHEINQLQREILRLHQQLSEFPPVVPSALQQQLHLTQSRMTIIQNRVAHRRQQNDLRRTIAHPEQDQAITAMLTTWATLKPQVEQLIARSDNRPDRIQFQKSLAQQVKALELTSNQITLRNRELQWAEYQALQQGQAWSLNALTLLLISFFVFAALFGRYAVQFMAKRQQLLDEMKQLSITDELTQVANRRHFNQVLAQEWHRMQRASQTLAVILIDIDCFKQYNDHYGHQAGDRCLQQVAKVLAEGVRRSGDFVARYGGEEFVIIVPNCTREQVECLTERLHDQLQKQALEHEQSRVGNYVTMSMGVTIGQPNGEQLPEQIVAYADQSLYQAKSQGRNRSCFHAF